MKSIMAALTVLCLASCATAFGQQHQQSDVAAVIYQKDSLFWQAYNTCSVPGMAQYLTNDVEFYHDKGGALKGSEALTASIKNNLCSNPDYHLRREAVPGTVQVFPLHNNGKVYGAIISGEHLFYITQGSKPEFLDGHARFSQLWLLQDGVWKMSRILSYDHGPAAYQNKRQAVQLPTTALSRLEGSYATTQKGVLQVVSKGDHLVLKAGNKTLLLYAESADNFFIKEQDLTFSFAQTGNGYTITVREKGAVVETATRSKP